MDRKIIINIFIIGFAMFAIFFGAGNIVFPPDIGIMSGNKWFQASLGLSLSAIILPAATIIAVDNMGGRFKNICLPVAPWFAGVYMIFFAIFILTCAIPRQGGVSVETGVFGVMPSLGESYASFITALFIYFFIVACLTINPSSIVDIIGKVLTPFLIATLFFIVIESFLNPIAQPVDTGMEDVFTYAFLQGYQTGDVAVGIVIAETFINSIKEKGYRGIGVRKKITLSASFIASVGLFIVYGGLLYLGATGSSVFEAGTDHTALLSGLVNTVAGRAGNIAVGIGVFIACLTTTAGLVSTIAALTFELTGGKIKYRFCVLSFCVLGFAIGSAGVSKIITYTYPIFALIYPTSIVITLLGCFKRFIPNHGAWKGAVIMSAVIGIYEMFDALNKSGVTRFDFGIIENIYNMIPFWDYGFAWAVPSAIGFIIGTAVVKFLGGKPYPMLEEE